tara:strand:+ start:1102 stop:1296 length:195 start_codon:yes stop_codon:yes gene_type:complete
MATEEVIVKVGPKGEVVVEVKGCTGKKCENLTKDFEKAIGDAGKSKRKPEFWQQKRVTTNQAGT